MTTERIVIVGGPRRGKSTMAVELSNAAKGCPIYCGDPLSKVKDPDVSVHYLPEDIPFSGDDGAAQWIAEHWFTMPGPWVCEGHVMARALRRWLAGTAPFRDNGFELMRPCERIIVLDRPGFGMPSRGQESMHTGVMTVWREIASYFDPITEYR